MSRPHFAMRRRTVLCVTLVVLIIAVTLAFVSAQDDAAATDAVQQAEEHHHHVHDHDHDHHHDHHDHDHAHEHHHEDASAAPAAVEEAETEAPAAAAAAAEPQEEQQQQQQQREAEEEAERQRQQQQAEEEARRQAEEAAAEQQRQREAEEEAERQRQQQAEEEAARRAEEARRQAAEEARRQAEEAERARRQAEEAAAAAAAAEKAKRELDSVDVIRYTAKAMPEGCAALVEKYLFRIHEERRQPASAVSEARAHLNEARVSESSGAEKLQAQLAAAQDALHVYDVQTLRTFGGNLPKTCIAEAQSWFEQQPAVESDNTYVQAYTHFYRLIAAHVYTMYRTGYGLVTYLLHSYMPSFQYFTAAASEYQNKAWSLYEELFPATGSRPEMPMGELAKRMATMAGYASVPLCLGIAAGVVAMIALAPVAAGIILYEFVYKIWAELFFFYYIYGMKLPEDLVAAAKSSFESAKAGQWAALGGRYADAFFDSVIDSDKIFYNGILIIFLLSHVVVICAILLCVWCRLCVPGMRGRKSRKSPLSATQNNRNASKNKAAQSAASGKKKASPSPAAADKKKK